MTTTANRPWDLRKQAACRPDMEQVLNRLYGNIVIDLDVRDRNMEIVRERVYCDAMRRAAKREQSL